MNNGLHIVTTDSAYPNKLDNLTAFTTHPKTVVYAHLATYESNSETYRSGDLTNFFNERSWILQNCGIDMYLFVASLTVHGLVDREHIKKFWQKYYDDFHRSDIKLSVFVVHDDLTETIFQIDDIVEL
jgi:hypothetical protein